jgi:pimeloyl-ACP methyl ester carboxylesterase
MKTKLLGTLLLLPLAAMSLLSTASAHTRGQPYIFHIPGTHPIVFLHGGSGSADQFESQAMRFESNGYPEEYVNALDYDSTYTVETVDQVYARIDQLLDLIQAKTGDPQIDLIGHSKGAELSYGYVESAPWRARRVARFINLDSGSSPKDRLPAGIPSLGLWGGKGHCVGCRVVGATNVDIPNETHVQMATSPESFVEMYKYLVGRPPATSDIVPENPAFVEISGKAVNFPQNTGVPDGVLQIWRVDGDTGRRLTAGPDAVYPLGGDGSWGPFYAIGGAHYEFAIVRPDAKTHHFYYEPFLRDDHLIRLLTEPANGPIASYTDVSPRQTNLIVMRNKELWGDQGVHNDVLDVDGVNVVSPATHPIERFIIATFIFDKGADGVSHLGVPIPPFNSISFFTAVDLFIPAASPPNASVSLVLIPREGHTQTINVPNWASTTDAVTVQFNDFNQEFNSWADWANAHLH